MAKIRHIFPLAAGVLLTALCSCNKTPDYVIGKKDMVSLLVDIHKGESVIDMNRGRYYNDSLRKTVKQSIYLKHGVTAEQVDTSFVWYGNHIEQYVEIYDAVIKQLEKELAEANGIANAQVFAEGDSTNVWMGAPVYRLTSKLPTKYIVFNVEPDGNWKIGDNYQLQFKIENTPSAASIVESILLAEYEDGTHELRFGSVASDGWMKSRLITDSTKVATRVFGSITFDTPTDEVIYLDSVSLVRTRLQKANYRNRAGQRIIRPFIDNTKVEPTDSTATDKE